MPRCSNQRCYHIAPTQLALICKAKEFADIRLRVGDKRILNALNGASEKRSSESEALAPKIRYPSEEFKGKIKSPEMKINWCDRQRLMKSGSPLPLCSLIQATLGNLKIDDFSLNHDVQQIFRTAPRLAQCLLESLLPRADLDYSTLLNASLLAKCLCARLWWDDPGVARQLGKIGALVNQPTRRVNLFATGPQISNRLVAAGYTSFKQISEAAPQALELATGRNSPFGINVSLLPKCFSRSHHS